MKIKGYLEIWWEFEALGKYFRNILENTISIQLSKNDYGSDIEQICILLICRQAASNYRVRKKYDKKNKYLYIDCILDFNKIEELEKSNRKQFLLIKLKETFSSLSQFKKALKDFNFDKFIFDTNALIDELCDDHLNNF
ncbi:MAG: hypothetical protein K1X55_06610 [Chitinophagales bacterium]|nr:hypothetical protein [Chitinophagales bacterium]